MRGHQRRPVIGVVALVVALSGCGSEDSTDSAGSAGDAGDARPSSGAGSVVVAWAAARTPAEQCDLLSSGFRFFIGDGDPSRTSCLSHVAGVIGAPAPGPVIVHGVTTDDGQTLVEATIGPDRTTFYVVSQYGGWRINSIGIREGVGPSPPPASIMDYPSPS